MKRNKKKRKGKLVDRIEIKVFAGGAEGPITKEYCVNNFLISEFQGQLCWSEGKFKEAIPNAKSPLGRLGKIGKQIAKKLSPFPGVQEFVITPTSIRIEKKEEADWKNVDFFAIGIIRSVSRKANLQILCSSR